MGFLSKVRADMRERESAEAILSMPKEDRPVLVYAEDAYTWNQLEGYIRSLLSDHARPCVYVTSDIDDPLLDTPLDGMHVFHVDQTVPRFLPQVDSPVFLTTMPDLDQLHVARPRSSICAYAFHSLNSTHMAYRTGAFDGYDVFLCTGHYQRRELTQRFEQIGKTGYQLFDVGYYKLDRIRAAWDKREGQPHGNLALIAPSWGEHNLLASVGPQLILSLLEADFDVIVRPHPAFFESIYPEGQAILDRLADQFGSDLRVRFERSTMTETSFLDADVLVADCSGASFEYAFATERPVLFIDLPPKVRNERWREIDEEPFELRMRSSVGLVLDADDAPEAGRAARRLIDDRAQWAPGIRSAAVRELFNAGGAAQAGAAVIDGLLRQP